MELTEFQFDEIRRYLRGEMTPEEAIGFEQKMEENPEFKAEVEFQRDVYKGVELSVRSRIKERLKALEAQNPAADQAPGKSINYKKWLGLAASIVVLIGIGLLANKTLFHEPTKQDIVQDYYKPYPDYITDQTRGNNKNSEFDQEVHKAMDLYTNQHYDEAIPLLEGAISKEENHDQVQFYLGNAYLANGNPRKAIDVFEKNQGNLSKEYAPKNQWYLALAYVADDRIKEAKQTLVQLKNKEGHYHEKAENLLEVLKDL